MIPNSALLGCVQQARSVNAQSAGTSTVNGTGIDMLGFTGVQFICALGALNTTATVTMAAQVSANNSDWGASGSNTTTCAANADNKIMVLDVWRPSARYVRPVLTRATANSAIDGVVAVLYNPSNVATSNHSTVSGTPTIENGV